MPVFYIFPFVTTLHVLTLPSLPTTPRPLVDKDLVLWHVFGAHHVPRLEDWPLMPFEKVSCMFRVSQGEGRREGGRDKGREERRELLCFYFLLLSLHSHSPLHLLLLFPSLLSLLTALWVLRRLARDGRARGLQATGT